MTFLEFAGLFIIIVACLAIVIILLIAGKKPK